MVYLKYWALNRMPLMVYLKYDSIQTLVSKDQWTVQRSVGLHPLCSAEAR